MLLFWVAVALLTGTATAFVVLPLLSGLRQIGPPTDSADEVRRLAVYRDRRREIEAEREAGRLTADEARRSLEELLAEAATQFPGQSGDTAGGKSRPASASTGILVAAIVAAVLVPAVSLGLYARLGAPELVSGVRAAAGAQAEGEVSPQAMDKMIRDLEARTRSNPGDGNAWANLASAYKLKGDLKQALPAYEKATELAPAEPRLLTDHAEALAMAAGGQFEAKALALLERALAADPRDLKSLILMGVAQYRGGNLPRARQLLSASVESLPPESEDARQIQHILSQIDAQPGGAPASGPRVATPAGGAAPATGAPAAPGATAMAGATVRGSITIDDKLRKQVPAGAVLFLVVRAAEGSRVPLAASRLSADKLPQDFEIGDAQAMDTNRLLSSAPQIVLEARVSGSGNAMRQSGDLFGTSSPVKPGLSGVSIRIDQRVP